MSTNTKNYPHSFKSILCCFALLLVINTHSSTLYPAKLSILSTGGALANAIFFFCSGYSLFHGSRKTGFIKWMVKRILRLYPSMWLFLFLSNLCLNTDYSWIDFIDTPFWFVNTIFIFYFGYYIIIHYIPTKIPLVIMALSIPYLGIYFFFNNHSSFLIDWTENPTCLHWFYYFAIMMLGAYFAPQNMLNIHHIYQKTLVTSILYFGFKSYIRHMESLYIYQFLIPVGLFPLVTQLFFIAKQMASRLKEKILLCRSIEYISTLSLDAYIIQFTIIELFASTHIPFRFPLAIITILIMAGGMHTIASIFSKWAVKVLQINT